MALVAAVADLVVEAAMVALVVVLMTTSVSVLNLSGKRKSFKFAA